MNRLKPKPVLAITSGDLVMDAFEQEYPRADQLYELYRGIVKDINFPVYSVLGNHDLFGVSQPQSVPPTQNMERNVPNRLGGKTYRSLTPVGILCFRLHQVPPPELRRRD
jgi:hypothetical protein